MQKNKIIFILLLFSSIYLHATSNFYPHIGIPGQNPSNKFCAGSTLELYLQNTAGRDWGTSTTNSYSVFDIYDASGTLINHLFVDHNITTNTTVTATFNTPGHYCFYSDNGVSNSNVINIAGRTPLCFDILAPPTPNIDIPTQVCVNQAFGISLLGVDNYNATIINVDLGSASGTAGWGNYRYASPGTYTIKVKINTICGEFEIEKTITVVNCSNCTVDASIEYERRECNYFTFHSKNQSNILSCEVWTLDGQIFDPSSETFLDEGVHQICHSVLGYPQGEPTNTCCDQKCITIEIPKKIIKDIHLTFCETDPDQGIGFVPCNYVDLGVLGTDFHYELTGSHGYHHNSAIGYFDPNFDNGPGLPRGKYIKGCIWHFLLVGNYTVNFYDSNGCLKYVLNITVETTPSTAIDKDPIYLTYCEMMGNNGKWYDVCAHIPMPTGDFHYTLFGFPSEMVGGQRYNYNSATYARDHGGNGCITHFLLQGTYEIVVYNDDDCIQEHYIVHVSPQTPASFACRETVNLGCNETFDPNSVIFNCPCVYSTNVDYTPWAIMQTGPNTEIWTRTAYDWINCQECVLEILVNKTPLDEFNCTKDITINCEEDFNINTVQFDCPGCPNPATYPTATEDWISTPGLTPNITIYTKSIFDPIQCKRCNFTVNVTRSIAYAEYSFWDRDIPYDINLAMYSPCASLMTPGTPIIHYVNNRYGGEIFREVVTNPNFHFTRGLLYEVHYFEIILPNGCICKIKITLENHTVGTHKMANPNNSNSANTLDEVESIATGLKIFPNPFSDKITIDYNLVKNSDININILNANGEIVKSEKIVNVSKGNNSYSLNLESLPNGLFVIKMVGDNFSASQKINHIK